MTQVTQVLPVCPRCTPIVLTQLDDFNTGLPESAGIEPNSGNCEDFIQYHHRDILVSQLIIIAFYILTNKNDININNSLGVPV